jgi:hypothetical protein
VHQGGLFQGAAFKSSTGNGPAPTLERVHTCHAGARNIKKRQMIYWNPASKLLWIVVSYYEFEAQGCCMVLCRLSVYLSLTMCCRPWCHATALVLSLLFVSHILLFVNFALGDATCGAVGAVVSPLVFSLAHAL